MTSDNAPITEYEGGLRIASTFETPWIDLLPEQVAALREYFASKRMPEDVQKLVAQARSIGNWEQHVRGPEGDPEREGPTLFARLVFALEAAQRPPVSPEVREPLAQIIADYRSRLAGLDEGDEPWSTDYGIADAILARFSFPTLDPEKIEALLMSAQHAPMETHDPRTGECRVCPVPLYELSVSEIAAALIAALPLPTDK